MTAELQKAAQELARAEREHLRLSRQLRTVQGDVRRLVDVVTRLSAQEDEACRA